MLHWVRVIQFIPETYFGKFSNECLQNFFTKFSRKFFNNIKVIVLEILPEIHSVFPWEISPSIASNNIEVLSILSKTTSTPYIPSKTPSGMSSGIPLKISKGTSPAISLEIAPRILAWSVPVLPAGIPSGISVGNRNRDYFLTIFFEYSSLHFTVTLQRFPPTLLLGITPRFCFKKIFKIFSRNMLHEFLQKKKNPLVVSQKFVVRTFFYWNIESLLCEHPPEILQKIVQEFY